jgi:hypothetical protein
MIANKQLYLILYIIIIIIIIIIIGEPKENKERWNHFFL